MVARSRRWLAQSRWGLAVGLGLTLAAAGVHLAGLTERFELLVYDWYVRNYSRIPASERIVHIDIDDDSLERVGSWPWPRDVQADLVTILSELGARRIIMDIVLSEPKSGEVRLPGLDPYADIEGDVEQVGEVSAENFVYPDDELARAIADAGNVYLSMYYEGYSGPQRESGLARTVAESLRRDFELDRDQLARQLKVEPERVERILAGVKRQVALERVRAVLAGRPEASAREVHQAVATRPFEEQTADRADILFAYLREQNSRALREKCPRVPPELKGKLPRVEQMTPPLYKFTAGTMRDGFVTFAPDFDGPTRRLPLMMEWEGRLLEQLAFAAARDELDIRLEDMTIDASGALRVAARGSRPAMVVPMNEERQALINWHVAPSGRWQDCFAHLPVTQLLRVHDGRARMRQNEVGRQIVLGEMVRLVKGPEGFELYRRQVNTLLGLEREARRARLRGQGETDAARSAVQQAAALRRQVESDQVETLAFASDQWRSLSAETRPAEADLAAEYDRFQKAAALISGDLERYRAANRNIASELERLARELRPLIDGKLCFVGYTATAVADMVNTPAYARAPGVLVHSSLLNSFLCNQFRSWSPPWAQALAILVLGSVSSIVTATRGPRVSLVLILALIIALLLVNGGMVFERLDHWLRLLTAMVLIFVVWALIVVVRYLTIERERRRFSRAVAQYVSPAMARRIADSAADFDLSPVNGVVTCFFSDLAGFTRISERLGPEGTRTVLNPYLESMSGVLHEHNALINKFIGDGIFAFFNPPILPCAGHERAACEAAVESARALRALKARHASDPRAGDFEQLAMRIGIGSGPVFVGDYGSENKLDYTCVGDTVNLASRLEGANKVFGTAIMVNGAAHDAAGAGFAFRSLGSLQVKGQTVAVRVYELMGLAGEVADEAMRFADLFGEAAAAFARRDWAAAREGFLRCDAMHPGDPGVWFYLATLDRFAVAPPGDDWNGGLELTEK